MDIILPTRFNNPNLPVLVRPGFRDTFDRPAAATLGVTDDGKEWEYRYSPWSITEDGTATNGVTSQYAVVDGLTPNGTLTTVIAAAAVGDQRFGVCLRRVDQGNYLWLGNNTSGTLTLYVVVGGSTANSTTVPGASLSTGDELTAVMNGPTITALLNGQQVRVFTAEEHQTATHHGLFAFNSNGVAEWDSIEFTPA